MALGYFLEILIFGFLFEFSITESFPFHHRKTPNIYLPQRSLHKWIKISGRQLLFFFPFLFRLFFPLAYKNIRTLKTYVVQRGDTRDCRWALQKHRLIPDASEEIKSVIPLFLRTSSKAVFKDGGKSSMGMAMGEAKVAEPTEPSAPTLSAFYCQGK